MESIRIGIAEDEPDTREFYQIVIPELGHRLLWVARSGVELLKKFAERKPDLLIVDIKMPFMDGLDAVRSINRDSSIPVPVIVVSGYHDKETMCKAEEEQILNYLVKPIREADLKAAIPVAVRRFEQLQKLRRENQQHTIFRAARKLMDITHFSEQQAMNRLKALATNENRTLVEISETILGATDLANIAGAANA